MGGRLLGNMPVDLTGGAYMDVDVCRRCRRFGRPRPPKLEVNPLLPRVSGKETDLADSARPNPWQHVVDIA